MNLTDKVRRAGPDKILMDKTDHVLKEIGRKLHDSIAIERKRAQEWAATLQTAQVLQFVGAVANRIGANVGV